MLDAAAPLLLHHPFMFRRLRTVRAKLTALVSLSVVVMLAALPVLSWLLHRQLVDEVGRPGDRRRARVPDASSTTISRPHARVARPRRRRRDGARHPAARRGPGAAPRADVRRRLPEHRRLARRGGGPGPRAVGTRTPARRDRRDRRARRPRSGQERQRRRRARLRVARVRRASGLRHRRPGDRQAASSFARRSTRRLPQERQRQARAWSSRCA